MFGQPADFLADTQYRALALDIARFVIRVRPTLFEYTQTGRLHATLELQGE